jgi:hypothetical protein
VTDFRRAQRLAHPAQTNAVMVAVIAVLVLRWITADRQR